MTPRTSLPLRMSQAASFRAASPSTPVPKGPDDAKAPTVAILGKVGTQASTNPSKGDGKTPATAYEFTVDEGTEIKLTALVSADGGADQQSAAQGQGTGGLGGGSADLDVDSRGGFNTVLPATAAATASVMLMPS